MHTFRHCVLAALMSGALVAPDPAAGQIYTSLGGGPAFPTGDWSDFFGNGFTVRGQAGLSLVLADAHVQGGWTRLSGDAVSDIGGERTSLDDANVFHAAVGARFGLGAMWVGANLGYFFGSLDDSEEFGTEGLDPDGGGIFPEIGVGLGPLEAVADWRIDGDTGMFGLRGALKF